MRLVCALPDPEPQEEKMSLRFREPEFPTQSFNPDEQCTWKDGCTDEGTAYITVRSGKKLNRYLLCDEHKKQYDDEQRDRSRDNHLAARIRLMVKKK